MFKIGIDNYGLYPLHLTPLETLRWAKDHGAVGVAFSGLDEASRSRLDCKQILELKDFAADHGLYLEWGGGQHIPRNMVTWERKDLFNHNRIAAEEAQTLGTRIIRSCSGGLMRWNPASVPTSRLLEETAETLTAQKQMLMDHNVILAIETHFEFTTFELLQLFAACGAKPGEWLGICLDTMNLLTMLEEPVMATERILPWVVSTHIKDGGLMVTDQGFKSFTAPFGDGIVDFENILRLLVTETGHIVKCPNSSQPGPDVLNSINLNIEDHGGSFDIPIFNPDFRREFPDLTDEELEKLVLLSEKTKQKMDSGSLSVLDRDHWPEVCEERMTRNILRLRKSVLDLS